jgi:hypothetical protein
MTQPRDHMNTEMDDEREPTAAELEGWQREHTFLPADVRSTSRPGSRLPQQRPESGTGTGVPIAKPRAILLRVTEFAVMHISDSGILQSTPQACLG